MLLLIRLDRLHPLKLSEITPFDTSNTPSPNNTVARFSREIHLVSSETCYVSLRFRGKLFFGKSINDIERRYCRITRCSSNGFVFLAESIAQINTVFVVCTPRRLQLLLSILLFCRQSKKYVPYAMEYITRNIIRKLCHSFGVQSYFMNYEFFFLLKQRFLVYVLLGVLRL